MCVPGLRGRHLTSCCVRGHCRPSEPRHAWDQTPEEVQLYILHDGIGDKWREDGEGCGVAIGNSSVLFAFAEEGDPVSLSLCIKLYQAVDPAASFYKVRKDRISIKLTKASPGAIWPSLRQVDEMTLEQVPPLPESFRAPKEDSATAADARAPAGNGKQWDELGDGAKMNVMAAERKTLEKLLSAAKMGDLQELRDTVDAIAAERALDARQILDEYRDGNGRGVVHHAASTGQTAVLTWAQHAGTDMQRCDTHGQSAFFIAAANGHHRCVEALCARTDVDADIDAHDASTGATALHHSAGNGDLEMVQLLLRQGADVNANSQLGPPIQWAAMSDHRSAVRLLMEHGADPNICAEVLPGDDRRLPPPLVMAASMMQTDVCEVFEGAG